MNAEYFSHISKCARVKIFSSSFSHAGLPKIPSLKPSVTFEALEDVLETLDDMNGNTIDDEDDEEVDLDNGEETLDVEETPKESEEVSVIPEEFHTRLPTTAAKEDAEERSTEEEEGRPGKQHSSLTITATITFLVLGMHPGSFLFCSLVYNLMALNSVIRPRAQTCKLRIGAFYGAKYLQVKCNFNPIQYIPPRNEF